MEYIVVIGFTVTTSALSSFYGYIVAHNAIIGTYATNAAAGALFALGLLGLLPNKDTGISSINIVRKTLHYIAKSKKRTTEKI